MFHTRRNCYNRHQKNDSNVPKGDRTMSKDRLKDSYHIYRERGGKHTRSDFYKFFWMFNMSIDDILKEEREQSAD